MDATLNARSFSGFYTTLEGLRAEGNINKEKISQLAEMKAAYEAMGQLVPPLPNRSKHR